MHMEWNIYLEADTADGTVGCVTGHRDNLHKVAKWLGSFQTIIGIITLIVGILGIIG